MRLLISLFIIYFLFKHPKVFLSLILTLAGFAFVIRHPFFCIGVFLFICWIVGWCQEIKNKKTGKKQQKSYEQYKEYKQRNENSYKRNTNYNRTYTRTNTSSSYFNGCANKDQLKKRHRQLCMKLHPDKGGNIEQFRKMQNEYEMLRKKFN